MQVYNISNQIHDKMIRNANQSKTFREEFATMLPASIKQIEQAHTTETSGVTPTVRDGESAVDNFMNAKRNWISICTQASALLKESSEMSVRDLFLKGRKLTNFLERQEF